MILWSRLLVNKVYIERNAFIFSVSLAFFLCVSVSFSLSVSFSVCLFSSLPSYPVSSLLSSPVPTFPPSLFPFSSFSPLWPLSLSQAHCAAKAGQELTICWLSLPGKVLYIHFISFHWNCFKREQWLWLGRWLSGKVLATETWRCVFDPQHRHKKLGVVACVYYLVLGEQRQEKHWASWVPANLVRKQRPRRDSV